MGQLINFADIKTCDRVKKNSSKETDGTLFKNTTIQVEARDEFKLTLNILVNNHPGKECFYN